MLQISFDVSFDLSFDFLRFSGDQISFDFREISVLRELPHQIWSTQPKLFKILSYTNVRPAILHTRMFSAVPAEVAIPSNKNYFGANKLKISNLIGGN